MAFELTLHLPERSDFPKGFVFGAATSSYQIEGQSFGGAGATHWDALAKRPGAIADGSDGAIACDHYHRFEGDLDLAQAFDAYRFSTNWARIMPDGRGAVNQQGLDFYDRLTDAILERGLQPFLTLYHWELPQALAEQGGWTNRDIAGWFGDFCDVVMARIGDRMASVATLNEPYCIAWLGHFGGGHAPGLDDIQATAHAMHNVLLAHGEASGRIRAAGYDNLGIVLNLEAAEPARDSDDDRNAAAIHDAVINRWYLEAITRGSYPDPALAGLAPFLPAGWDTDFRTIQQPLDWLGVNYYTRQRLAAKPGQSWPGYEAVGGPLPKTAMGWEVYPQGLVDVLARITRDYTNDLPIFITENGAAFDGPVKNGRVDDSDRVAFMNDHLRATLQAIENGANVRGFFYWSLLDNFEWAYGYEKRFGLVHVDYETQKRTPKLSFQSLKQAVGRESG
ncbi:MAG TPA: beta-glucosidase [Aliiroseovarius sp.]|nr:beta-glucosidase [Aliiroseovarius sp.]